jgi:hypothetical protein
MGFYQTYKYFEENIKFLEDNEIFDFSDYIIDK